MPRVGCLGYLGTTLLSALSVGAVPPTVAWAGKGPGPSPAGTAGNARLGGWFGNVCQPVPGSLIRPGMTMKEINWLLADTGFCFGHGPNPPPAEDSAVNYLPAGITVQYRR